MHESDPAAGSAPFVGSYSPRIDALEKVGGRADYLADLATGMRAQGLLYASCLRSPYPAARIVSLDTSRAEAMPGVVAVLTCNDDEVRGLKPTNASWTPFFTASYERMSWPSYRDRRVLGDTAHWAGDEVGVVVAAETKEAADAALEALDVEWEQKPFVLDLWEAMEPGAPLVHPEINPEGNTFPPPPPLTGPTFLERGDVEQGFAESDVQVEFETSYHNPDHGCLETRGCMMQWDGDRLTCWTSYYAADQPRMSLANMLEMPLNKVRVMNPYIGGSFGRGNEADQPFLVFTALLAKRCGGRPVLYRMDRRQDFHDTRSPVLYRVRAGARADGTILALHTRAYSQGRRLRRRHDGRRRRGASRGRRALAGAHPQPPHGGLLRLHQHDPRRRQAWHRQQRAQPGLGTAARRGRRAPRPRPRGGRPQEHGQPVGLQAR